MRNEGKYSHLWMKYAAVIHVLLKKTDIENQKFQLYKHEFEFLGSKQNSNITFSLDVVNGKVVNLLKTSDIARDLWRVLDDNSVTKNWLKERSVKISIGKNYDMQFEQMQRTLLEPSTN
jgi:hypothetical protein